MKKFRFKKIDAFTNDSYGNPAGCIYLDKKISEDEMQKIAWELKGYVNEVVFCLLTDNQEIALRYYSSECEVDFCGHGTIACMYDLVKNNQDLLKKREIRIQTKKGELTVYNHILSMDAVYVSAPIPEYKGTALQGDIISESLGMPDNWLDSSHPIDLINAGLHTLIVPIDSIDHILKMRPDMDRAKGFCLENQIDIITAFYIDVQNNKKNCIRTRVFAPKYGYLEDPATGSGNSAVGYYLLKNHLWDGNPISIEQGKTMEAPNIVKLDTVYDVHDGKRVIFGGCATNRIEGLYLLY